MGTFWWGVVVGVIGTVALLATTAELNRRWEVAAEARRWGVPPYGEHPDR